MTGTRISRWAAALAAAGALGAAGCNILGPVGYFVAGPPDIKAVCKLPPDRTAVIFIDDRESKVSSRATRGLIGETAERDMLSNGAVKDMVSSRNALQVAMRERYGKPMTMVEIGKAVGAKTVIYATVDQFTMSTDAQTFSPGAVLRVKVIDVDSEQRMFPGPDAPSDWFPVTVKIGHQAAEAPKNSAELTESEQNLAKRTGIELARLFYDHAPPMDSRYLNDAPK